MFKQMEFGNINNNQAWKDQRGWLVGWFAKGSLMTDAFEFKYGKHPKGETKTSPSNHQKVKTFSILISGKARLSFPDNAESYELKSEGDYLYWDESLTHTLEVLEDSLIITFRWPSLTK